MGSLMLTVAVVTCDRARSQLRQDRLSGEVLPGSGSRLLLFSMLRKLHRLMTLGASTT